MRYALTWPTFKVRPSSSLVHRMTPLCTLMKRSGSPSGWRLAEVFRTRSKLAIVSPQQRWSGNFRILAGEVTGAYLSWLIAWRTVCSSPAQGLVLVLRLAARSFIAMPNRVGSRLTLPAGDDFLSREPGEEGF